MAAKKKKTSAKKEELTFEKSLEELEGIVRRLDAEALGVEDAMAEYEKGLKALKRCRAILDEAERKLEILVKEEDGKAETKPLPSDEETREAPAKAPGKRKAKKKSKGDDGEEPKDGFLF